MARLLCATKRDLDGVIKLKDTSEGNVTDVHEFDANPQLFLAMAPFRRTCMARYGTCILLSVYLLREEI